jgi:hypothetical protein
MIDLLKLAGLMMAILSAVLIFVTVSTSLRTRKSWHFVCGLTSMVAAITYGCVYALEGASSAAVWCGGWFLTGFVQFANATFRATE